MTRIALSALASLNAEEALVDGPMLVTIAESWDEADPNLAREICRAMALLTPLSLEVDRRWCILWAAMAHPDHGVQEVACAAVSDLAQETPPPSKVETRLQNLLESRNGKVQFEAAFALSCFGNSDGKGILEQALGRASVRLDALKAIAHLRDPSFASAIERTCMKRFSPWVDRLSAASTLVSLGFDQYRAFIVQRLSARNQRERMYAAALVGQLKLDEATSSLLERIQKRDAAVDSMVDALCALADPEVLDRLDRIDTPNAKQAAQRIRAGH